MSTEKTTHIIVKIVRIVIITLRKKGKEEAKKDEKKDEKK